MTEDEYLDRMLRLANVVLVSSQAHRKQALAIAPSIEDRCHVIPERVDLKALKTPGRTPEQVLIDLGIPRGSLVVAGCGQFAWRKGVDLFAQVAARVVSAVRSHSVYFVWIGAPAEPPANTIAWTTRRQFDFDVRRLGLEDRVILVPPTPDAAAYIRAADVFISPSREDPFPLVAIEAAAFGKPVVCFDSSGTAEMVRGDAGAVIPHLDVLAMSNAVNGLVENEPARLSAGAVAAARAAEYDVSRIAPRVLAIIDQLVNSPSGTLPGSAGGTSTQTERTDRASVRCARAGPEP